MLSSHRRIVVQLTFALLHASSATAQHLVPSTFHTRSEDSARFARVPFAKSTPREPGGEQLVIGWLGSVALGFLAWRAFDEPAGQHRRVRDDWGYTPAALTALAVGSYVGATVGVWASGRSRGATGTLLGTALGVALPTLPIVLTRDDPLLPLMTVVAWAPLQGFFGYMGYKLSAKPVTPSQAEVLAQESPVARPSTNVILADDIAKSSASNVFDLIVQLRPQWLTYSRRATTPRDAGGEPAQLIAYLEGSRYGTVDMLRQLPVAGVREVTYIDAATATNRYGTGHSAGVITVYLSK